MPKTTRTICEILGYNGRKFFLVFGHLILNSHSNIALLMKKHILSIAIPLLLASCTTTPTSQKTIANKSTQKSPTIALVLGGGGAKGFAHIGVIDELEKNGIRPTLIVGTSAGAIIGANYASGKTPKELIDFANHFNEQALIDISPSHQGLLQGNKLKDFVNAQVNHRPLEQLPIRFVAVATDMQTNTATPLTIGDTGLAVQASASLPKLFIPPRIDDKGQLSKYGKRYNDGGQTALVPAVIARSLGADIVIAVDVMADNITTPSHINTNHEKLTIKRDNAGLLASFGGFSVNIPIAFEKLPIKIDDDKIPTELNVNIPKDALNIIQNPTSIFGTLSTAKMTQKDKQASDVIITPTLSNISVIDIQKKTEAIAIGRSNTTPHITTIKALIHEKTQQMNQK